MSNVKQRNMLEIMGYIILVVCTFIPAMYNKGIWEWQESFVYHGASKLSYRISMSFFNAVFSGNTVHIILGLLVYAGLITGIVLAILQYNSKNEKQNNKVMIVISGISLAIYLICSISLFMFDIETTYFRYAYEASVLFWVVSILMVMLVAYSVFSFIKFNEEGLLHNADAQGQNAVILSDADELKKYKELLDEGIISQEEYEQKKKQLLGL